MFSQTVKRPAKRCMTTFLLVPGFYRTLHAHYYILSEHIAISINCPRNSLAPLLSLKACEGKKPNLESTTSVMITGIISSKKSSCLAICGPLH